MVFSQASPRVLSFIPGRIRLHVPGWKGDNAEWIENHLRRITGVQRVQANPLTGNVLIHFDPLTTDADTLLTKLREVGDELPNDERPASADGASVTQPANDGRSLVRVGVRGLLGHAVVDSLWFGAGFHQFGNGPTLGRAGAVACSHGHCRLDDGVRWRAGALLKPSLKRKRRRLFAYASGSD
jgi:cation transport ATPase